MKKFDQLSKNEQDVAMKKIINFIISSSIEIECFPSSMEKFDEILENVLKEVNNLETPWFAEEALREKIETIPLLKRAIIREANNLSKVVFFKDFGDIIL